MAFAVHLCHQCSPGINRSLLTFFFDGVPQSDTTDAIPLQSGQPEDTTLLAEESTSRATMFQTVHYPYGERECAMCHDENARGNMVVPEPDLCYICHEDFSDTYNYVHGPAAGGYCTACHDPHMSKEQHLLKRTGQPLCLFCHDETAVFKNEIHEGLGDISCMECHNPHGGEDRFIFY